jgi:hypothetical protein
MAEGHTAWVRSPSRSVRLCDPNILLVRKSNGQRGLKIYISECPLFASVHIGPYERGHCTSMSTRTQTHTHTHTHWCVYKSFVTTKYDVHFCRLTLVHCAARSIHPSALQVSFPRQRPATRERRL